MNLSKYFSDNVGVGVLSTANKAGEVNSAVYAKPHTLDNGDVAFIMRDKLTHVNVNENPNANFLFIEHDHGYNGTRLNLQKIDEITDPDIIATLSRRTKHQDGEKRFLVVFRVTKALQLIGGEEIALA